MTNQNAQIAIIIPACDEAECIGLVLKELLGVIDPNQFAVVVGINGSSDRTSQIVHEYPVLVAETPERGYGFGCQSAIDLAKQVLPSLRAYLFFAGDGASDPRDLPQLVEIYGQGYELVLGSRTRRVSNWRTMTASHVLANFALGFWCAILTGRRFSDLAPLRLISGELFDAIAPREMTYGWTIETQVAAAQLGAAISEVNASERPRLAGKQKVSGVTWSRTFRIGCQIVAAGYRTRLRFRRQNAMALSRHPVAEAAIPSQSGV